MKFLEDNTSYVVAERRCGSEEGSYLRLIDLCTLMSNEVSKNLKHRL